MYIYFHKVGQLFKISRRISQRAVSLDCGDTALWSQMRYLISD